MLLTLKREGSGVSLAPRSSPATAVGRAEKVGGRSLGCQPVLFPTRSRYALQSDLHCQIPTSRSCCSARCAWRMSRAVFLSAQPCCHGLQRPQADDLRALILRWVSLVFTGFLNDAACGAALFLGHAAFVVWPQVPPPFGRGYQGVFAFVGQGKCQE